MAYCKVKLYSFCKIDPVRNMLIDNIETYLDTFHSFDATIYNTQFIKPTLETTLTLDVKDDNLGLADSQEALYSTDLFTYNYLSITPIGYDTSDIKTMYYFITDYEWRSKSTIKLMLRLDVLNTYQYIITTGLTHRTAIIREHRDRFDKEASWYSDPHDLFLRRLIDKENEGFDLPKYNSKGLIGGAYLNGFKTKAIEDLESNYPKDWYLVYKNETYTDGTTDKRLPIQLQCFYEDDVVISKSSINNPSKNLTEIITATDFYQNDLYVMRGYETSDQIITKFTVGGREFTISSDDIVYRIQVFVGSGNIYKLTYNNGVFVKQEKVLTYTSSDAVVFNNCPFVYHSKIGRYDNNYPTELNTIKSLPTIYVGAGRVPNIIIPSIDKLDKTDPKIIKIIKLPYAPTKMRKSENGTLIYDSGVWFTKSIENTNYVYLEMYDITHTMENKNISSIDLTPLFELRFNTNTFNDLKRNDILESKLLSSEFTSIKFDYADTEFNLSLEDINGYQFTKVKFPIDFKVTNTINSNFLFKFNISNYMTPLDYPNVMVIKTNNESLIMNSSYLNYVNNGYNYDKKHNKMDLGTSIFGSVIGAIGQVGALASGVASGGTSAVLGAKFGSGIVSDAVSTITNHIKAEDNLKRSLVEYNNTKVNISGSDDIDLRTFITNNKLWVIVSSVRGKTQKDLQDLFYYTGYSYPYQEIPELYSRRWFNFIQCKPEYGVEVLGKIRRPLLNEITQKLNEGVTIFHSVNGVYDIDQKRENLESWIEELARG